MFVPVACSQCGKPFQVPEATIGKSTACPWCQTAVLALPVSGLSPVEADSRKGPGHQEPPVTRDEPLPLDDAPPVALAGGQAIRPADTLAATRDALSTTPRRGRLIPVWVMLLGLSLAVAMTTMAIRVVLRYKEGYFINVEWKPFTPPDSSCQIDLLGRGIEAEADKERGERLYVSEGWYSGTTAWIGWRALTPAQATMANAAEGWQVLLPVFDAERDRLKRKYGGYVAKDATISFQNPITVEVRLETTEGRVIERMLTMPNGPRPRVYFIGMAGKGIAPDGPEVKRFFDSFRVNE